ncbi:restriction endonuclease subunit S [Acidovorax sp. SUPP3334]|uniref:restriction endonuclease subunit S n=1 Tax=Acidovorax sp. SUPP3334 TaxID=2920881 RepID=UPI0023DE2DFF|nr:restriction endonuclease subunit S [Acidovorax sp. SUPP3334]GKT25217.1 restriction endonuclease subunit S [Acidovorax sp. SUPP3334]
MSSESEKCAALPKLRFAEFQQAAEWKERKIGDFLTESRLPGSKGDIAKKLTVKLWGNGVFGKNEAIQGSINTQYFRRNSGQFIYSKLDFLNQAFGIIPPDLDGYESTVDLPCFDISEGLDPVFLLEYVKRKEFYERLGETADGSRKARRIHTETFQSFPIALPTSPEQKKIADCLSSLDELIAAQARKVDALKTHKKGLMQQLFPREGETQPRLRFPEFRDAAAWEPKAIGQLGEIVTGSTPSTVKSEYYGGDRHFVSPADISDNRFIEKTKTTLTELGFLETRPIKANSIFFVCIGSTIGKIAQNKQECATNQQINAVVPSAENSDGFVYYAISGIADKIANIAGKQAVPIVNKSLFSSVGLSVPNLPEQKRIADCMSSLDETIFTNSQVLEALKNHKKGLMQQLFPSLEEEK